MRILIFTQYHIPEPHPKMHILGKELMELGHDVTIITGFPNYPLGKIYHGYRQKLWQRETIDGVKIIRLPLYPERSRSAFKRILNYLSFLLSTSLLSPFLCGKIDVVMVWPPIFLTIPAEILGFIYGVPFVYEIQDMWPETLAATGMISNRSLLELIGKFCSRVYKKAAVITVISPGFKKNLVSKGVPSDKIRVLCNWAYEGDFPLQNPDPVLAEKLGCSGYFNVLYAGNMGLAQGLHNIIEAASLLTDIKDLRFVFLGDGVECEKLKKLVAEKKLDNVMFLPRVTVEQMPSMYALAEAVMVHLIDDPLFDITIPGKTQSSLLSGKPIIMSVNGDAADLILKAEAGFAVPAMKAGALAGAVRKLYNMSVAERKRMGLSGRSFYLKNLAPKIQVKKYEQIFQEVLAKKFKKNKNNG